MQSLLFLIPLLLLSDVYSRGIRLPSSTPESRVQTGCAVRQNTYHDKSAAGADFAASKQWRSAEICFAEARQLTENPDQKCEALANIAACQGGQAMYDNAYQTLIQAIRDHPTCGRAHADVGRLLARSSQHTAVAAEHLSKAMQLMPKDTQIADDLAHVYFGLDRIDDAVAAYKEAVTHNPTYARGYQQMAVILRERKDYVQSAKYYRAAINLEPTNAAFHYSHGNMLFDSGDVSRSLHAFTTASTLDPHFADAYNNKGNAERNLGRLDDAIDTFLKGLKINPKGTMFWLNAGQVYQDMNKLDECENCAKQTLQLDPRSAEAYLLLGSVAYARDKLEDAVPHYTLATTLNPGLAQAYVSLANTLGDLYRKGEASLVGDPSLSSLQHLAQLHSQCVSAYRAILHTQPTHTDAFVNMMWARKYVCDWEEWDVELERMVGMLNAEMAQTPHKGGGSGVGVGVPSLKPFLALAFPISPQMYLGIASAHAKEEKRKVMLQHALKPVTYPHPHELSDNRLVIGYISSDMQDHPVGHQAWFHLHQRSRFHIVVFSVGKDDASEWRTRIRTRAGVGGFEDVSALDNLQRAARINSRQVHVLVTLNGWTSGHHMPVLSLQPAPIQVAYMGSHDTSGASYIQFFFSDVVASPPEYTAFYSEAMVHLPHSFFMNEYRESRAHILKAPAVMPTRREHNLPDDAFVFCNFNQLFKVDPNTFSAWMNILRRVPNSVLWLLRLPFGAEAFLRAEAKSRGISPSRLIFSNRSDWRTHLYTKALADLSLDAHVFNSHTSGVDILWAGVPMLTAASDKMSGRVAASLIRGVDVRQAWEMGVFVARDLNDYVDIAVRLATTPGRAILQAHRSKLQAARPSAPVFDTARIVKEVERGFTMMWESHAVQKRRTHLVIAERSGEVSPPLVV